MFGFSTVNIAGPKKKSVEDVSRCRIRDLCEHKGDKQIEVTFFKLPSVAKEVISPLHQVQMSSTFQELWIQYGKKAQAARKNDETKKPHLSISEVVENIWKPAFQDWSQHAASTMDGTISLENVDKLFGTYKNRKKELERELLCLFELSQVLSQTQPASRAKTLQTTVTERVIQVQRYQQLDQYAIAADTIWEFKEAMAFTGDFKVIEDLRNQVSKFMFPPFLFRLFAFYFLQDTKAGFLARFLVSVLFEIYLFEVVFIIGVLLASQILYVQHIHCVRIFLFSLKFYGLVVKRVHAKAPTQHWKEVF